MPDEIEKGMHRRKERINIQLLIEGETDRGNRTTKKGNKQRQKINKHTD